MEIENSKEENEGEDEGAIQLDENNEDKDANLARIGNQIFMIKIL